MADEVEHEDEGIDAMRLTRVLTGVAMAAAGRHRRHCAERRRVSWCDGLRSRPTSGRRP